MQTEPLADGSALSPHDPLLPVLLAVPVGIAGVTGAKVLLALLAGVLAGLLVWVAVRRFGVRPWVAGVVVGAFGVSPPLAAYATQVYPELPAALAVTVAVAALTGPPRRGGTALAVGAVVALPWLGVKYAPVAAALALVLLWRRARGDLHRGSGRSSPWRPTARSVVAPVVALVAAGVAYLALHRLWYGGWTVYAAGDHFVGGELDVVGVDADYLGRSQRLVGLLVDRDFGLVAWGPVVLVAVAGLGGLLRRRPEGWEALVLPLAAGWLNATFVALTMHGVWWPGRQVVVVIPCAALVAAWWVDRMGRAAPAVVVALGVAGMALWGTLLWQEAFAGWSLILDVDRWANPVVGAWRRTLPDARDGGRAPGLLQGVWVLIVAVLVGWSWSVTPDRAEPVAEAPTLT